MADISMCSNNKCPSHKHCYRYSAVPNPFQQAYSAFTPDGKAKQCEWYWPDPYVGVKK